MNPEGGKHIAIQEDEVANPDTLRATEAGVDIQAWNEAVLLAPLLDANPLDRALELLRIVGGLGRFLGATPVDLQALGLEPAEVARIQAIPSLSAKLMRHHYQQADLSTRKQLADEFRLRAVQSGWDVAKVLVVGWTESSNRVLDRILFEGHPRTICIDIQHAVRLALCANATVLAMILWAPDPMALSGCDFRRYADDLRIAGSFFSLAATDFLVLSRDGYISLAVEDQWIE